MPNMRNTKSAEERAAGVISRTHIHTPIVHTIEMSADEPRLRIFKIKGMLKNGIAMPATSPNNRISSSSVIKNPFEMQVDM